MNLQELPKNFAENRNELMAKWIIKYQDYKSKAALYYAPKGYTTSSLINYHQNGIQYIKNGKKNKMYNWLYPYIDKFIKEHLQPLTPSLAEKRKVYANNPTSKEAVLPIQKLECVSKHITAKIQYGVKFDDFIKLFESEEEAKGFNKGIEYAKGTTGRVVTVEIEDV